MASITKPYPLLKENRFVNNEAFVSEMASMKVELIKWYVGTIITVAGVVAAILNIHRNCLAVLLLQTAVIVKLIG